MNPESKTNRLKNEKVVNLKMLGREALAKLFPTPSSLVVFVAYMGMFVAQGMLVTASRNGSSSYSYNTVTVVLLTEMMKLVLSSTLYLKE